MKYIIRLKRNETYLATTPPPIRAVWVDWEAAHRFNSEQKAKNFMAHNFRSCVEGKISPEEVELLPCDRVGRPIQDGDLVIQSEEEATRYLEALSKDITALCGTAKIVRGLYNYYSDQLSVADQTQEDMLHQIEFVTANASVGYKMYKSLHDLRLRRRQCKDICGYLDLFTEAGLTENLNGLESAIEAYRIGLEARVYKPRVLKGEQHEQSA